MRNTYILAAIVSEFMRSKQPLQLHSPIISLVQDGGNKDTIQNQLKVYTIFLIFNF